MFVPFANTDSAVPQPIPEVSAPLFSLGSVVACQLSAVIPEVFIVAFSIVYQKKYIYLYIVKATTEYTMAGEVRQPIDIPSLERYLNQNVPEIKTPLDVKQASLASTT